MRASTAAPDRDAAIQAKADAGKLASLESVRDTPVGGLQPAPRRRKEYRGAPVILPTADELRERAARLYATPPPMMGRGGYCGGTMVAMGSAYYSARYDRPHPITPDPGVIQW